MTQIGRLQSESTDVRNLVARERGFGRTYREQGVSVHSVASFGQILSMPIAPGYPFALSKAAKHCDLLAIHAPFPLGDLGLLVGIPNDKAVVLHWHAEISGIRARIPFIRSMSQSTVKRADCIIVTCREMVETSPMLASAADKCFVVPYGTDVDYWSALTREELDSVASIRLRHPRLVVSVGRLVPYKGYPVLLEAMRNVDAELIIVGEGREAGKLRQLVEEFGLSDRVHFKGFLPRDAIKLLFHASELLVLSSISSAEAFGIVQVEAMAAGLPVINTRLKTTVPQVARNNIEGLTVEPGNAGALSAAINLIFSDGSLRTRFASNARKRAAAEFSTTRFLLRLMNIYHSAIDLRTQTAKR